MSNKELISKELAFYKSKNRKLKSLNYNKDIIPYLFEKFNDYGINQKLYGKRFYLFEDEKATYIYIYLRDKLSADYHIWFSNKENT